MPVVSDTSTIINLAVIGQLELLRLLFSNIVIPQAVDDEIVTGNQNKAGYIDVQSTNWIQVMSASDKELVARLELELDKGEAESIALAIELNAELILLDEKVGREIAKRYNLIFTGVLGILLESKNKGYLSSVKPVLNDLMIKAGFWNKSDLYSLILRQAGE